MQCQDCGAFFMPGQNSDMIQTRGCPECGSYRTQPSPTNSEMEPRDMAAPGENDMGGNPLQEGILGDWNNRMKRDESYGKVKVADAWAERWTDPKGNLAPGWHGQGEAPELYQMRQEQPRDLMQGTDDDFTRGMRDWQPGTYGRGLIDGNGVLHVWDANGGTHQKVMQARGIDPATVRAAFNISDQNEIEPMGQEIPEDAYALIMDKYPMLSRKVEDATEWGF